MGPELITPDEVPIWVPGQLTVRNPDRGWRGLSVRGFRYNGSDVKVPPVRDYTIVAYHRGRTDMRRRIDGNYSSDALGPGDVSLMTRAADSRWTWSQDIEVSLVFLGQDEVAETCQQMYDREVSDVDLRDVLKADDTAIYRTATQIASEAAQGSVGSQLMVDSLTCQMAVHLLRRHSQIKFREPGVNDSLTFQQIRLVRDYVHEHLHENILLQDLAGSVALSRFHFSRQFRNATGTTPHEFVLQQRVTLARTMLHRTRLSLREVASACGFADQSHMTRIFRTRLGITPGRYRRER